MKEVTRKVKMLACAALLVGGVMVYQSSVASDCINVVPSSFQGQPDANQWAKGNCSNSSDVRCYKSQNVACKKNPANNNCYCG